MYLHCSTAMKEQSMQHLLIAGSVPVNISRENNISTSNCQKVIYTNMSQWSSDSMLACGMADPRFELRCGQKVWVFAKISVIHSFGHGLHTYCSA